MQARLNACVQFEGMREDRRHGRWLRYTDDNGREFFNNRLLNESVYTLTPQQREHLLDAPWPAIDPYSNELYMPLRPYLRHETAAELLHNGQTLQARL
jgi:hypothetical protein